jgi:3'-5' exoribonuclease
MEKQQTPRQSIQGITVGDKVREVYLIAASEILQARNGPYWRLELRDATGSLEARIWAPHSQNFSEMPAGRFALVEGRPELYRDQLQLHVACLRLLDASEQATLDITEFMAASASPPAEMLAEIEKMCRKVLVHAPWRKLAESILNDPGIRPRLLIAPAATTVHHACVGGLLEHMLSVARLCLHICDVYPELDRQTLFIAALFHDIGKLWEISGGLVNEYTTEGKLLGHLMQGISRLEPHLAACGLTPELAMHFKHLILSHHGTYEFGAARLPLTAEAFALHHADNLDAKLAQIAKTFPQPPENNEYEWSPFQKYLDRAVCRAPRTPSDNGDN